MLPKSWKPTWLSIWKKRVEPDILANFQMMEEVLYEDRAEIQNALTVSLKRKIANTWEQFRTLSKVNSTLMALKLNNASSIFSF
jgi:hypothetical protein